MWRRTKRIPASRLCRRVACLCVGSAGSVLHSQARARWRDENDQNRRCIDRRRDDLQLRRSASTGPRFPLLPAGWRVGLPGQLPIRFLRAVHGDRLGHQSRLRHQPGGGIQAATAAATTAAELLSTVPPPLIPVAIITSVMALQASPASRTRLGNDCDNKKAGTRPALKQGS